MVAQAYIDALQLIKRAARANRRWRRVKHMLPSPPIKTSSGDDIRVACQRRDDGTAPLLVLTLEDRRAFRVPFAQLSPGARARVYYIIESPETPRESGRARPVRPNGDVAGVGKAVCIGERHRESRE